MKNDIHCYLFVVYFSTLLPYVVLKTMCGSENNNKYKFT